MGVAAKLEQWQAAGLIDAATAEAIRAHEHGARRPVALLAVAGLGVLALALGVLLVVAANWDALSPALKLGVQLALTLAAAAAAWRWGRTGAEPVWAGEVALFLLAGLTLAGIALQAQIYQQTGALWQALAWWAVLAAPALLLLGRTRLIASALGTMLIVTAIAVLTGRPGWWGQSLAAALPAAFVVAALALPAEPHRATFRAGLMELGLTLALMAASAAQIAWVDDLSAGDAAWACARAVWAVLLVAIGVALAVRRLPRPDAAVVAAVLAGALAAGLLALGLPHGDGVFFRLVGLVVYGVFWSGVAVAASRAGWSRLFTAAVAALAVRLFVVYFELFYGLAFTGVGLIVGGLLLIALTWASTRIVRQARP